jgi:hypothetical protein
VEVIMADTKMTDAKNSTKDSNNNSESHANGNNDEKDTQLEYSWLDVSEFASPYIGIAKVRRLLFVAQKCPEHAVTAYKLAIDELKT